MTDQQQLNAAIVIQARMGSSRLPGKTTMTLSGMRMLEHIVARFQIAPVVHPVIVATSTNPVDDFIASLTESKGIACVRGSEEDVLGRYWQSVADLDVDYVVRATADNPLVYEGAVEQLCRVINETGCDYISYNSDMVIGLNLEVFTKSALQQAHEEGDKRFEREHVTPFFYTQPDRFDIIRLSTPAGLDGDFRLTVDTRADFEVIKTIYDALYKPGRIIPALSAVEYLRANPEVAAINSDVHQKRYDEE